MVSPVTCTFNNFPDSPGSGWKHSGLIQAHATHIDHMEAVHVLGGGNCITHCALINVVCLETMTSYSQDNDMSQVLCKNTDEFLRVHQYKLLENTNRY